MMNYFNNKCTENELVNIIIGLSFPRANFPQTLFKLGYKLKGVEQAFVNSKGNTVKPDIIVADDNRGFLIIFEAKSGKNAEEDQLKNYNNISSKDLIQNAGFSNKTIKNGYDITFLTYKYTYVNNQKIKAYENLIKSIKGKYKYPVLMFNKKEKYLSLELNRFKDNKLNEVAQTIEIPVDKIPKFINFDQHSDEKEIKIEVVRNIISYILKGKLMFSIEEVLNDIISPYPGIKEIIGAETKKAVRRKLMKVLKQLRQEKPSYFEWNRSEQIWEIDDRLSNPNYNQLEALHSLVESSDFNVSEKQMHLFEKYN